MPKKEYTVNKFITVKLEDNRTIIYVAGEPFNQCAALLLNIPIVNVEDFEDIESIDEIADMLNWDIEYGQKGIKYDIPPETEFFGHCSNLQAWYEHDYNTNLLHSTISFPLLKKLVEVGDLKAQKVFKEEVYRRYESGSPVVLQFLSRQEYYKFLSNEDIISIFSSILNKFNEMDDSSKLRVFSAMIAAVKGTKFIQEEFLNLLTCIDKIPDNAEYSGKFTSFALLINTIKGTHVMNANVSHIETKFVELLDEIGGLPNNNYHLISNVFSGLMEAIKGTDLLEEYFTKILKSLDKIDGGLNKMRVFFDLISTIKGTKLLEENFIEMLNTLDKIDERFHKDNMNTILAFLALFKSIKGTELMNKHSSLIELRLHKYFNIFSELPIGHKYRVFSDLVSALKGTRFLVQNFLVFLDAFEKIDYYYNKVKAFSELIFVIKGTNLLEENLLTILKAFHKMDDDYNHRKYSSEFVSPHPVAVLERMDDSLNKDFQRSKCTALSDLIHAIKGKQISEESFQSLLKALGRIDDDYIAINFSQLILAVKGTGLLEKNFIVLLNLLDSLTYSDSKSAVFSDLIFEFKKTDLLEENFILILDIIEKINGEENKIKAFDSLTLSIKKSNDKYDLIKARFPEYSDELEEILKGEKKSKPFKNSRVK